jgi:hypothetical protein
VRRAAQEPKGEGSTRAALLTRGRGSRSAKGIRVQFLAAEAKRLPLPKSYSRPERLLLRIRREYMGSDGHEDS